MSLWRLLPLPVEYSPKKFGHNRASNSYDIAGIGFVWCGGVGGWWVRGYKIIFFVHIKPN